MIPKPGSDYASPPKPYSSPAKRGASRIPASPTPTSASSALQELSQRYEESPSRLPRGPSPSSLPEVCCGCHAHDECCSRPLRQLAAMEWATGSHLQSLLATHL